MDGPTSTSRAGIVARRLHEIVDGAAAMAPEAIAALLAFLLCALAARLARPLVQRVARRYAARDQLSLVAARLTQWTVVSGGFLLALAIVVPSFRLGDLIQLLGIGSVAIGFAFRDILQNLLSGLLLLLSEPFRIGDEIVVAGAEGTVEDIETRATTLRTSDGRRVVIPNSRLFTEPVTVNSAFGRRRSEWEVEAPIEALADTRERLEEALRATPGVRRDPPAEVVAIGGTPAAVKLRARWWTEAGAEEAARIQDQVVAAAVGGRPPENGPAGQQVEPAAHPPESRRNEPPALDAVRRGGL